MAGQQADAFVQAVIAPVQDEAARQRCEVLLRDMVAQAVSQPPPPRADSWEDATARLRKTAPRFNRSRIQQRCLVAGAALVSLWPGLLTRDTGDSSNSVRPLRGIYPPWDAFCDPHPVQLGQSRISARVNDDARKILFGDTHEELAPDRWKSVWMDHSGDAVLYARYVSAFSNYHGELPPDYVETGERIDPGNGWYRFFASTRERSRESGLTTRHLTELQTALAMPRFDSHRDDFLNRQLAALPPARDQAELNWNRQLIARTTAEMFDSPFARSFLVSESVLSSMDPLDPLAASMLNLSKIRATKLLRESRTYSQLWFLQQATLTDLMEENRSMAPDEDDAEYDRRDALVRAFDVRTTAASWQAGFTPEPLYLAPGDPGVSPEELRPPMDATRAMTERLALRGGLLISLVALVCCWIARIRWRCAMDPLAERFGDLLRPRDQAVILLGGLMAPLALYLAMIRMPRFGIHARTADFDLINGYHLEATALAVAVIALSLELVSWRLSRRGGIAGLRSGFDRVGWLFATMALASFGTGLMPSGVVRPSAWHASGLGRYAMTCALWMMPAAALSWPLLAWFRALLAEPARQLYQAALAHALMRPLALSCATFTAMTLLSQVEERYWTARDTLETPRPGWAGNHNAVEARTAAAWQQRFLNLLDPK